MLIVIYIPMQNFAGPYMWGWGVSDSRSGKTPPDPIETHKINLINLSISV